MPEIYFLEFDDENSEHLARHGVTRREVRQLLANQHVSVRNPRRADRRRLIGRTDGGRVLTVVMEPTQDPGTWRPVAGWDAEPPELKLLTRHGR